MDSEAEVLVQKILASQLPEEKQQLIGELDSLLKIEPSLLQAHLSTLLELQRDSQTTVQLLVLDLIEEVLHKYPESFPQTLPTLLAQIESKDISVLKKAIRCGACGFQHLKQLIPEKEPSTTWAFLVQFKEAVLRILGSHENKGVLVVANKFLETLVLSFSFAETVDPEQFDLSRVEPGHPFFDIKAMEEEGKSHLGTLLERLKTLNTTETLLMLTINSLTRIVTLRQNLMDTIVPTLSAVHNHFGQNVTSGKLQSVRATLHGALVFLLKYPRLVQKYHESFADTLEALGDKTRANNLRHAFTGTTAKRKKPSSELKPSDTNVKRAKTGNTGKNGNEHRKSTKAENEGQKAFFPASSPVPLDCNTLPNFVYDNLMALPPQAVSPNKPLSAYPPGSFNVENFVKLVAVMQQLIKTKPTQEAPRDPRMRDPRLNTEWRRSCWRL